MHCWHSNLSLLWVQLHVSELPEVLDASHASAQLKRLLLHNTGQDSLGEAGEAPMSEVLQSCCGCSALPWLVAAAISSCTVSPLSCWLRKWSPASERHATTSLAGWTCHCMYGHGQMVARCTCQYGRYVATLRSQRSFL